MEDDLSALENMIYSGRGITAGMTPDGDAFIAYTLTGRSPPSQARELLKGEKTSIIRTNVITDEETLKRMFDISEDEELIKLKGSLEGGSPALLYYAALIPIFEEDGVKGMVGANGVQSEIFKEKYFFEEPKDILGLAFKSPRTRYDQKDDRWIDITTYEPDSPNNTPRISACMIGNKAAMHIVRFKDGKKDPEIHPFNLEPGKGKLITTYEGGNQKPLSPFVGEPLNVGIGSNSVNDLAESFYKAIYGGQTEKDNYRVSAAAMLRNKQGYIETKIINRSQRGE